MNPSGRGLSTRPERAVDREKATLRSKLRSACAKSRTAIGLRGSQVITGGSWSSWTVRHHGPATSQVTFLTRG